ncbi:hypothetical protein CBR_g53620 [Chara braunii]|uniref:DUF659 domain-containing protein n=1 Tax=Chara braunii TaxID=69332 RepID=A0A388MB15_CHABU|nr:hypothetical protein CBR_g53620 [Chara braunii]|eukprot:GBG91767.1 hypothetical protein CBR_g53620 [Chara braunii]
MGGAGSSAAGGSPGGGFIPQFDREIARLRRGNLVWNFVTAGQLVGDQSKMHGDRKLHCNFCSHVWQGNAAKAARHFTQPKYCKVAGMRVLANLQNDTDYRFVDSTPRRVQRWMDEEGILDTRAPVGGQRPRTNDAERDEIQDVLDEQEGRQGGVDEAGMVTAGAEIPSQRTKVVSMVSEVPSAFQHTGATIVSDGRKSRSGKPLVNFLAGGGNGALLYATVARDGSVSDTADIVYRRWRAIILSFPAKDVIGFCTDSASNYMAAACRFATDPNACSTHVCNLMLSDVGTRVGWVKETIIRARVLVRFFKSHGAAHALFRNFKLSSRVIIVEPVETRFASVFLMLTYLKGWQDMLGSMLHGDAWARIPWERRFIAQVQWVQQQIHDGEFWQCVDCAIRVMAPVHQLLRRMDKGGMMMSIVYEWSQHLLELMRRVDVPADMVEPCMREGAIRNLHMLEPAHAATHLLNPRRRSFRYYESLQTTKRNWAQHERINTARRNKLGSAKLAQLVEIATNLKLAACTQQGGGYVLLWVMGTGREGTTGEEEDDEGEVWGARLAGSVSKQDIERQVVAFRACRPPRADPVKDVLGKRATKLQPWPEYTAGADGTPDANGTRPTTSGRTMMTSPSVATRRRSRCISLTVEDLTAWLHKHPSSLTMCRQVDRPVAPAEPGVVVDDVHVATRTSRSRSHFGVFGRPADVGRSGVTASRRGRVRRRRCPVRIVGRCLPSELRTDDFDVQDRMQTAEKRDARLAREEEERLQTLPGWEGRFAYLEEQRRLRELETGGGGGGDAGDVGVREEAVLGEVREGVIREDIDVGGGGKGVPAGDEGQGVAAGAGGEGGPGGDVDGDHRGEDEDGSDDRHGSDDHGGDDDEEMLALVVRDPMLPLLHPDDLMLVVLDADGLAQVGSQDPFPHTGRRSGERRPPGGAYSPPPYLVPSPRWSGSSLSRIRGRESGVVEGGSGLRSDGGGSAGSMPPPPAWAVEAGDEETAARTHIGGSPPPVRGGVVGGWAAHRRVTDRLRADYDAGRGAFARLSPQSQSADGGFGRPSFHMAGLMVGLS